MEVPDSGLRGGAKKQLPHENNSVIDTFVLLPLLLLFPSNMLDGGRFRRWRRVHISAIYLMVLNYIHKFFGTPLFKR